MTVTSRPSIVGRLRQEHRTELTGSDQTHAHRYPGIRRMRMAHGDNIGLSFMDSRVRDEAGPVYRVFSLDDRTGMVSQNQV